MRTKRELLELEDRSWHDLCARLHKLTDDELERPGVNGEWSAKDVMAHVAAWHALMTDRLESLRSMGELPRWKGDVDTFNKEKFEECRGVSLHDVRVMFESSRHRFREEMAGLTEPLPERVAQVVAANAHEHYAEHIEQLDAFLEAR